MKPSPNQSGIWALQQLRNKRYEALNLMSLQFIKADTRPPETGTRLSSHDGKHSWNGTEHNIQERWRSVYRRGRRHSSDFAAAETLGKSKAQQVQESREGGAEGVSSNQTIQETHPIPLCRLCIHPRLVHTTKQCLNVIFWICAFVCGRLPAVDLKLQ